MTNHPNRSLPFDWPAYLRAFRSRAGLSQVALANALGVSRRTVEEWEGGRNRPPEYLKLAIEYLIKNPLRNILAG